MFLAILFLLYTVSFVRLTSSSILQKTPFACLYILLHPHSFFFNCSGVTQNCFPITLGGMSQLCYYSVICVYIRMSFETRQDKGIPSFNHLLVGPSLHCSFPPKQGFLPISHSMMLHRTRRCRRRRHHRRCSVGILRRRDYDR